MGEREKVGCTYYRVATDFDYKPIPIRPSRSSWTNTAENSPTAKLRSREITTPTAALAVAASVKLQHNLRIREGVPSIAKITG